MISRQWRGVAKAEQAQNYIEHLRSETFPRLAQIPGFIDASILSRRLDQGVEFQIVTRWTSMAAIAQFAGADTAAAVVPENVRQMMLDYDSSVSHYEIVA
jgi:heme-degrading monooxygenase HmoA